MRVYPIKMPKLIQRIYPSYLWRFSSVPKTIYLTFDDGPTPEVTKFVLDQLKKYHAKATFFCIGKNVKPHSKIYVEILKQGHSVGNHTFNHRNGFLTKNDKYLEDIEKASNYIDSNLFRPPYGKIKNSQAKLLQKKGYKIVMWDVISGDFDQTITPEKCLENVLDKTTNGSIVVFHDSLKAKERLYYALPNMLAYFKEKGYNFKAIS